MRLKYNCTLLYPILIFGCGTAPKPTKLKSYVPLGNTVTTGFGSLGIGFDRDRNSFLGECASGNVVEAGTADSTLYFENSMSFDSLKSNLGISMNAAHNGAVKVRAAAKFLNTAHSSAYSVSSIYSAIYSGRSQLLTNIKLTPLGESLVGKPEWKKSCGHEFVQQLDRGAQIFVAMTFSFASAVETNRFQAEVGVSNGLTNGHAKIDIASEKFRQTGAVKISAYQLGGDETRISEIFGSQEGGYAIVECRLDKTEICKKALNDAISYAAEVFPKQLTTTPNGYAPLAYVTKSWETLGVSAPSRLVIAATDDARRELDTRYFQLQNVRARLETLLTFPLARVQKAYLEGLQPRVLEAIGLLTSGLEPCFDALSSTDPFECRKSASRILAEPSVASIDDKDPKLSAMSGEWEVSNFNFPPPHGAVLGGVYGFNVPMYVCRVKVKDGVRPSWHVGKLLADGKCRFGYDGEERISVGFDVLLAKQNKVKWIAAAEAGTTREDMVIGGSEGDKGEIIQGVCRVELGNEVHVGKERLNLCHIGYGGREHTHEAYQILVFDI